MALYLNIIDYYLLLFKSRPVAVHMNVAPYGEGKGGGRQGLHPEGGRGGESNIGFQFPKE